MSRHLLLTLSTLVLAGCAGAGGPTYEFGPSEAPLRYALDDQGTLLVETPVGEQRSTDSTVATLVFNIGGGEAGGHRVTVTFEALEVWAGGDFQQEHFEGGDLLAKPFTGTLADDGSITVTAAPEIAARLEEVANPNALFSYLLPPLPPGGDERTEAWAHTRTETSEAEMTVETFYEGTASFAGDTTWNGTAARVIVSQETVTSMGHGTPAGSPGAIEFTMHGKATTRYVWDPQGAVMLASSSTTELAGELEVIGMAMTMPVSYHGRRDVWLKR
ncbi:MAG: hypothetical protein JSV86_15145 [Gemmatimonadota bacterium]|nr:MAG: hypothetical protein JSV86_15145 [Gemmatimonadota bacterium]